MIDSTSLITHSALRESDPASNPGGGERHHFPADKASPYFDPVRASFSPHLSLSRESRQQREGEGLRL